MTIPNHIVREYFALEYLRSSGRAARLPGGINPADHLPPTIDEQIWLRYGWNPPGNIALDGEADIGAGSKPSWATIAAFAINKRRQQFIARLDAECTTRITAGYGEQNEKAELHFRLRATESGASNADKIRQADGNTERDRLRARYQAIKAWINTLTDLDTLADVDFSDPDYWSLDWTPPA